MTDRPDDVDSDRPQQEEIEQAPDEEVERNAELLDGIWDWIGREEEREGCWD